MAPAPGGVILLFGGVDGDTGFSTGELFRGGVWTGEVAGLPMIAHAAVFDSIRGPTLMLPEGVPGVRAEARVHHAVHAGAERRQSARRQDIGIASRCSHAIIRR